MAFNEKEGQKTKSETYPKQLLKNVVYCMFFVAHLCTGDI
jgi:hypothetical protein